jgi:hypothetical protein
MSEKLYAWLLRLYPAHFREEYGDEALRLFRDRARDECGFFPRLRLWLDLFVDFTISVPREYLHVPAPRVAAAAPQYPVLRIASRASVLLPFLPSNSQFGCADFKAWRTSP